MDSSEEADTRISVPGLAAVTVNYSLDGDFQGSLHMYAQQFLMLRFKSGKTSARNVEIQAKQFHRQHTLVQGVLLAAENC